MPIVKQDCAGCRNDFYNDHNPHGVKECWSFKEAALGMFKKVPVDEVPPHTGKPRLFPTCYHADGFAMLDCASGDRQYFG